MNLYFDTEFTGLQKDTSLISLGIIDENDHTFYAEFIDYNEAQCNQWITENVIKKLLINDIKYGPYADTDENSTTVKGDKAFVASQLWEWLKAHDDVMWVSDVCQYDMVLLIDLISPTHNALNLPKFISSACFELNNEIAKFYGLSSKVAFDKSREDIVKDLQNRYKCEFPYLSNLADSDKHNSLYDAKIIKAIYNGITTVNNQLYSYFEYLSTFPKNATTTAELANWARSHCKNLLRMGD